MNTKVQKLISKYDSGGVVLAEDYDFHFVEKDGDVPETFILLAVEGNEFEGDMLMFKEHAHIIKLRENVHLLENKELLGFSLGDELSDQFDFDNVAGVSYANGEINWLDELEEPVINYVDYEQCFKEAEALCKGGFLPAIDDLQEEKIGHILFKVLNEHDLISEGHVEIEDANVLKEVEQFMANWVDYIEPEFDHEKNMYQSFKQPIEKDNGMEM